MSGPQFSHACTIGGVATTILEAHAVYGAPVATCSLVLPLPLPSQVVDNAPVAVTLIPDSGSSFPMFTGNFRTPDKNLTVQGATATLLCTGPNDRLTYALEKDVVFAGGAATAPASIVGPARHVGVATIAWYANHAPDGNPYDATVTPTANSEFVWIAGRIHGSNDYQAPTTLKTKKWSRVEVWQAGNLLGYGNLPVTSEQYGSMLDYTDDANWQDFTVFVTASIRQADGDATIRFTSGTKPGSTERDDYEVKSVTWQTAGQITVRQGVRGFYARAGFAHGTYAVDSIVRVDGTYARLGGNGYVDAGQVRVGATERPLDWIARVAGLWGYVPFDCPDGVPRVRPVRGVPPTPVVATFTEGVNVLGIPSIPKDAKAVFNAVRVDGASGSDQNGKQFAYSYQTASPAPNALIPTPPGIAVYRVSDAALVSNDICAGVGAVQERNRGEGSQTATWDSWPIALKPGDAVRLTSPTADFDANLFVTAFGYDIDSGGYRMSSITGWTGVSTPFGEAADSDPMTPDAAPTTARPADEWHAYRPSAGVN